MMPDERKLLRSVGLSPDTDGGKRSKRLKDQIDDNHGEGWPNMEAAPIGGLCRNPHSGQSTLWESRIELGVNFFHAVTASPIPIDMRALRALKRSHKKHQKQPTT